MPACGYKLYFLQIDQACSYNVIMHSSHGIADPEAIMKSYFEVSYVATLSFVFLEL